MSLFWFLVFSSAIFGGCLGGSYFLREMYFDEYSEVVAREFTKRECEEYDASYWLTQYVMSEDGREFYAECGRVISCETSPCRRVVLGNKYFITKSGEVDFFRMGLGDVLLEFTCFLSLAITLFVALVFAANHFGHEKSTKNDFDEESTDSTDSIDSVESLEDEESSDSTNNSTNDSSDSSESSESSESTNDSTEDSSDSSATNSPREPVNSLGGNEIRLRRSTNANNLLYANK